MSNVTIVYNYLKCYQRNLFYFILKLEKVTEKTILMVIQNANNCKSFVRKNDPVHGSNINACFDKNRISDLFLNLKFLLFDQIIISVKSDCLAT